MPRVQRFLDTVSSYEDRINVLKEQAEVEGYSLSEASETAFWKSASFDFAALRSGRTG